MERVPHITYHMECVTVPMDAKIFFEVQIQYCQRQPIKSNRFVKMRNAARAAANLSAKLSEAIVIVRLATRTLY